VSKISHRHFSKTETFVFICLVRRRTFWTFHLLKGSLHCSAAMNINTSVPYYASASLSNLIIFRWGTDTNISNVKISVFLYVSLCNLVHMHQRFEKNCSLHLHGRINSCDDMPVPSIRRHISTRTNCVLPQQ
jgi:hypothetical protein